jgi:hypothetical protein
MIVAIIAAEKRGVQVENLVYLLDTVLQLRDLILQVLDHEVLVLEVEWVVVQEGDICGLVGRLRRLEELLEGYLLAGGRGVLRVHLPVYYFCFTIA